MRAMVERAMSPLRNIWQSRARRKEFILIFCLYVLAFSALILADVYYVDDYDRAALGYRGWANYSRYASSILATFMNLSPLIMDMSPVSLLLALGLLSLASLFVISFFTHDAFSFPAVCASLGIGLSPFFFQNMSYQYDAPFMALAILCSIIPFLYAHDTLLFPLVSCIGIMGTLLTYQAGSGIYILCTLFFMVAAFVRQGKFTQHDIRFLLQAILCYSVVVLAYQIFLAKGVAAENVAPLTSHTLISGFLQNIETFLSYINRDIGRGVLRWAWLLMAGSMVAACSVSVQRKKYILVGILSAFLIPIALILSYGAYLVLANPSWQPRAFMGFGSFTALMGILLVGLSQKKEQLKEEPVFLGASILVAIAMMGLTYLVSSVAQSSLPLIDMCLVGLGYSLYICLRTKLTVQKWYIVVLILLAWYAQTIFMLAAGNALKAQDKYQDYRITLMMQDLAPHLEKRQDVYMRFGGAIGYAPLVKVVAHNYPVMQRHISQYGDDLWTAAVALPHYGVNVNFKKPVPEGSSILLVDNVFHTISLHEDVFQVIFKAE